MKAKCKKCNYESDDHNKRYQALAQLKEDGGRTEKAWAGPGRSGTRYYCPNGHTDVQFE